MKYIFFRIIKAIPVVLGVTILTFLLLYFSPLDPAQIHFHQLGVTPTKEMLFEFQEKNGLNVGFIGQYLHWWRGILHGDFGESFADAIPVIKKLSIAIPYTVVLAFASLFLTLLISIPFGFFVAIHGEKKSSKAIQWICTLVISLPNFIVALGLMYLLSSRLHLIPILTESQLVGGIMPVLTLSIGMSGKYIQQIEVMTRNELHQEYVYGMLARGISRRSVLMHTVLKNVSVELVTIVGMSFGSLLGGVAVVESIFNWPGLGKLMVDSVSALDIPVVQGIVLFMALSYIVINLFTDLLYGVLDPRIRIGGRDYAKES